jgi:xanthine dehydrogenase FAD-binding subunit
MHRLCEDLGGRQTGCAWLAMVSLYDIRVWTPSSLTEALEILQSRGERVKLVAGGTDLIIQMKNGLIPRMDLLNIQALRELQYIRHDDNMIRVGALTTFTEISRSPIIRRHAVMLAQAADTIGSIQIMNKATLGGNLVNASPAADSLPPLYALNATVKTVSKDGSRTIPIERFYMGYKKLDLRPSEIVAEVIFSPMGEMEIGGFFKHGLRLGDAISVVNGSIWARRDGEIIEDVRVALGAVAPTVVRARACERVLKGSKPVEDLFWRAAKAVLEDISPITDVRGTAEYRREMAVNYVYMTLHDLLAAR